MARLARTHSGRVTPVQLLGALLAFAMLSAMGGALIAGLLLPVATVAGNAASSTIDLFNELDPELAELNRLPEKSDIYDRNGELIATFYDKNRVVVPLEEISPWIQQAVVATEDKRFFDHNGVDGEGLMRAAYINLTSEQSPGASTLTQQLIKNTLLTAAESTGDEDAIDAATEVSFARKLREAKLALTLEANMAAEFGRECTDVPEVDCGKEKILEQYLNIAQFGVKVYGVEASARFYFNKSAADLNALEAATMAGITQNPSKWDPTRYPEYTVIRRDTVLLVMYKQGMITEAEFNEYVNTPLEDYLQITEPKFSCVAAVDAPFFCDYVTKVMSKLEFERDGEIVDGRELLYTGGLEIYTTLDLNYQRAANRALVKAIPPNDPSGFANALVSMDPTTGEILAMAQNKYFVPGSSDIEDTAINYSVDREFGGSRGFSPGSTFKPIILAQWLKEGHYLEETVSGSIREWVGDDWHADCLGPNAYNGTGTWKPGNVGNTSANQQNALSATAHSINTSYVAMTAQLDLCGVRDMATALGFKRADGLEFEVVPSMALGTQNASPLTMAVVASTLANDGVQCEPRSLLRIVDRDGQEYDIPPTVCRQVIARDIAQGVTYAMTRVMEVGSGRFVQLSGRRSAGKTGTAQNNTHTWFMGFVPQLATVTWLGHPDRDVPQQNIVLNGKRYRYVYGSTISAPTWEQYMETVLAGQPALALPSSAPATLGTRQIVMPDVLGMKQKEARNTINDAGLRWVLDPRRIYSDDVPQGTVVYTSVEADTVLGPGATVTYQLSRDSLPGWFTAWPDGWDPCVAPSDWWGQSWPPVEFDSNPPSGWNYAPCEVPDPEPSPSPSAS